MTDTGLGGGTRLADIVTRYRFDENGNLRSIVDARGTETTFDFDPAGPAQPNDLRRRIDRTVFVRSRGSPAALHPPGRAGDGDDA
jgi:YD repeat-containing protein